MSFGWGASPCIGLMPRARATLPGFESFAGPLPSRAEDRQRGFNDLAAER